MYEAVISIIRRHPMNRFEIQSFYESRHKSDRSSAVPKSGTDTIKNTAKSEVSENKAAINCIDDIFSRLDTDKQVVPSVYKGIVTYRLK